MFEGDLARPQRRDDIVGQPGQCQTAADMGLALPEGQRDLGQAGAAPLHGAIFDDLVGGGHRFDQVIGARGPDRRFLRVFGDLHRDGGEQPLGRELPDGAEPAAARNDADAAARLAQPGQIVDKAMGADTVRKPLDMAVLHMAARVDCVFQRSRAVIPLDRGQQFHGIVGTYSMNLGR
jgi:hypothetical protein